MNAGPVTLDSDVNVQSRTASDPNDPWGTPEANSWNRAFA